MGQAEYGRHLLGAWALRRVERSPSTFEMLELVKHADSPCERVRACLVAAPGQGAVAVQLERAQPGVGNDAVHHEERAAVAQQQELATLHAHANSVLKQITFTDTLHKAAGMPEA